MLRPFPAVLFLLPLLAYSQTGPFASNTRISGASGDLCAVDVNGDGKMDLVVGNRNAKRIAILLGDGAGSFHNAPGSPVALPADSNGVVSLTAADLDRDGKVDLAFVEDRLIFISEFSATQRNLFVWFGVGDGSFRTSSTPVATVRTEGSKIAAADIDGDGNLDLVVDNDGLQRRGLSGHRYMGNGNGGFSSNPLDTATTALGDFNGDGRLDFVTSTSTNPGAVIIVNLSNPQGSYTSRSYAHSGAPPGGLGGATPQRISVSDYDRDGFLDIFATVESSSFGRVLAWRGDGNGGFVQDLSNSSQLAGPALGANRALAIADFDGDGVLDWAGAGPGDGITVTLLRLPATTVGPDVYRYQAASPPVHHRRRFQRRWKS